MGIGHRLFRLSQVCHISSELAGYPLLLVIGQVVVVEGEKGIGGLAIFVGADGTWSVTFFEKLGEVGSCGPIVNGAIGVDGEFEIIAPTLFEGRKETIGDIAGDLRYWGVVGIKERVGAFITDLAPDAEELIMLPINDFTGCEVDGEVHEAIL